MSGSEGGFTTAPSLVCRSMPTVARRHHDVSEQAVQRVVWQAARDAALLGHKEVQTTMIYTHTYTPYTCKVITGPSSHPLSRRFPLFLG